MATCGGTRNLIRQTTISAYTPPIDSDRMPSTTTDSENIIPEGSPNLKRMSGR